MRHRGSVHPVPCGRARRWAWPAAVASVALMLASGLALFTALSRPSTDRTPGGDAPVSASVAPGRDDLGVSTSTPGARPAHSRADRAVLADRRWRTVVARLDRRRAQAYAAADPALLRSVYVPRSAPLRRDRALLARYARGGLRVRGLRMEVARLHVRRQRPGQVLLWVRDRVAAGTVVGRGSSRALPADDLDRRLLTLRRVDRGVWLVAAVRPVAR